MSSRTALLAVLSLVWIIGQSCTTAPASTTQDTQQPTATLVPTTTDGPSQEKQTSTTTPAVAAPAKALAPAVAKKDESNGSYLEEIIPPCTPVAGSLRDPCAAGTPPSISTPGLAAEEEKVHALPLHDVLNYRDALASLSTHIVLRGTILPDTTRCDYHGITMAEYLGEAIQRQFAGWEQYFCFSDVQVNEYLLGTGSPQLTVITDWHRSPDPYPGPSLEELIVDAYEGVEGILFLSTGFTLQLEAWEMVFFWDVQQVGGETRVIATDKHEYPQTPENLALLDFSLADFRVKITEANATRNALTGGRIGTDSSLPLLITDANQLPTYYGAIGAVYDDPTQTPAKPPPVPGADDPEGPPANTGENETPDDDQTPPTPGDDNQPPGSEP